MLRIENSRIVWEYDGQVLWVEPWGKDSLRVRAVRLSPVPDENWALLPQADTGAKPELENGIATLKNGEICARVDQFGHIVFTNSQGKVLLKEFIRDRTMEKANFSAMMIPAREFTPLAGGSHSLVARFESNPKEKLYGMGQYQQEILNLKGCTLELAHRNSQVSIPFLLSSLGYGFLWNNPAIGQATLGTNRTEWTAKSTRQMDYFITAGKGPKEIMHNYSLATGLPSAFPDFATGFWQCKMRYQSQEELMAVAREYKRRKLPISVLVIDFFHWPNQGLWEFDKKYWPDPKAMAEELKEMGITLFVSVWPTVDPRAETYPEMLEKGFLTHTERGSRTQLECGGYEVFYDTTNPGARDYVWQKLKKSYYDCGIKNYWLDAAEPESIPYHYDNLRYHRGQSLEVGNLYPFCYGQTVYDGLTAEGETQVLSLERCAWAGSQRIGTLVWSGDIYSDFEVLRRQLIAGLHMAVAGIPWWTTDIGGFDGGNPDDPAFRELLVRWFQYGTFCPVMRLHGARVPTQEPLSLELGGGFAPSGAPNEVWSFGDENYEILKGYMELRERLRPYVKEQMALCHKDGTPPMRPLFYDFPKDNAAWEIQDAYMFGPALLVAPILFAGADSRKIYLPKGAKWIEVATGTLYNGGETLTSNAPLDTIPLFLREGAGLSLELLKI